MRTSYEITASGVAGEILVDALRLAKISSEVLRSGEGVIARIGGGGKRIDIRNFVTVDGRKIETFAVAIARATKSQPEIAALGVLAWLGIVPIEYIIAAAIARSYHHAIAARRCYELLKARSAEFPR